MTVSIPTCTYRSTKVVAGSSIVTPAAINAAALGVADDSADSGKLRPAVDAANLVGVGDGHRLDLLPALPVDGDQVGQVVLSLGVFGSDAAHRVEQSVEGEGVDARVDLLDGPLVGCGVLLFDDPLARDPRSARCVRSRTVRRRPR